MDRRRIVIVANETVVDIEVPAAIFEGTEPGDVEVVVVSPALNSRLRHWVSDTDGATAEGGAPPAGLAGDPRRSRDRRDGPCRGRRPAPGDQGRARHRSPGRDRRLRTRAGAGELARAERHRPGAKACRSPGQGGRRAAPAALT